MDDASVGDATQGGGDRPDSLGPTLADGPGPAETIAGATGPGATARPWPSVAGYEVLGELGRGGMGVVYHARQLLLNRPCALKMILSGDHAEAEASVRFLAEAEAVARLRHPDVVQIRHIGEAGGRDEDGVESFRLALRDLRARRVERRLPSPFDQTIVSLAFSPDGSSLALGCEGGYAVHDLPDLRLRARVGDNTVTGFRFSDDGRFLALVNFTRTVKLWSVASSRPADPTDRRARGFRGLPRREDKRSIRR